jgi:predicted AlkP superfamily pyrophosphatase or phosphodiesterase
MNSFLRHALGLLIVLSFVVGSVAQEPTTQPRRRVLIVSIDGLRPDLMLRARTPVLTGLMESGTFTR